MHVGSVEVGTNDIQGECMILRLSLCVLAFIGAYMNLGVVE